MLLGLKGLRRYADRYDYYSESAVGRGRGLCDARAVMSQFGYWRDPLFLLASAAYALNRWVLKPLIPSPFLHNHFNDLLLIAAALPVVLWMQRLLRLRGDDRFPSWAEVLMHWAVWSIVCEWIGPFYFHMGVADIWDVVAYGVGGIAAALWWNRWSVASLFSRP
jgi:hypothetical protein